jgi:hypothetical protein
MWYTRLQLLQLSALFKLTSVQGWEKYTIYWYSQGHLQPSLEYEEVSEKNLKELFLKESSSFIN